MLYQVNQTTLTLKDGIQLLDLLQTIGVYKLPDGKVDYACTTEMIDKIVAAMKSKIIGIKDNASDELVDLAIALMVIPIPPVIDLAQLCLKNISETIFNSTCYAILESTVFGKTLAEKQLHYIEQSDMAIGIIARYLHGNKQQISAELVRETIVEVTKNIRKQMYLTTNIKPAATIKSAPVYTSTPPWTEITLTSCECTGPIGPTLQQCTTYYTRLNMPWVKHKDFFDVAEDRPGIQLIKIVVSGTYSITAYGASSSYRNHGSGNIIQLVILKLMF